MKILYCLKTAQLSWPTSIKVHLHIYVFKNKNLFYLESNYQVICMLKASYTWVQKQTFPLLHQLKRHTPPEEKKSNLTV